jgi:hypothetical protein
MVELPAFDPRRAGPIKPIEGAEPMRKAMHAVNRDIIGTGFFDVRSCERRND